MATYPGANGRVAVNTFAFEPSLKYQPMGLYDVPTSKTDPLGLVPRRLSVGSESSYDTPIGYTADGRKLLFARLPSFNDPWQLVLADSDGGSPQVVYESANLAPGISISPGGDVITFGEFDYVTREASLYRMNVDGTNKLLIAELNASVSWSPDGSRLAYVNESDGITIADFNPGGAVAGTSSVPNLPGDVDSLDWSPDGSKLVFSASIGISSIPRDLFSIGIDGSALAKLTKGSKDKTAPVWSPDGLKIAYTLDADKDSVYTMDADGKRRKKLTKGSYRLSNPRGPVWQPLH